MDIGSAGTHPQAGSTSSQANRASLPQAGSTSSQASSTSSQASSSRSPKAGTPMSSSNSPSLRWENTLEEPKFKLVINLSSKPLTQGQRSLLAKGPNFVVTSRNPPNIVYITALESVCSKLGQQDVEELRANINRVLKSSHPLNLI